MPSYAGPLNQSAPTAPAVDIQTVPDLAARDLAANYNSLRDGGIFRVVSDGHYYQLVSKSPLTWFDLGTSLLASSYLVVDDVTGRDAIPAGERFEGLQVYSKASGLIWILKAGLANTDWEIIRNQHPDLFEVDPVATIPVHTIYVETPGNGGDDVAGEGTVAAPFATPQKAMEATRGQSPALLIIKLGLGSFNADDGPFFGLFVQGSHQFGVQLAGTTVELVDFPSYVNDGLVPGKQSQVRVDVGAYTETIVEGVHFVNQTFPGFEAFPTYLPCLSTSVSPKIEYVGPANPFTTNMQVVSLGTTLTTSAGQMSAGGRPGEGLEFNALIMRSASGFLSLSDVYLNSCDVSNLPGSDFLFLTGCFMARGCYFDLDGITIGNLSIFFLDNLVNRGYVDIYGAASDNTVSLSRCTSRHGGAGGSNFRPGHRGFADTKPTPLFIGSLDLEAGTGIDARGFGTGLALQTDINVEAACTRALRLADGATLNQTGGSADFLGSTAGVPVVVDTQARLENTVNIFDGNLANGSSPGDEITVGGNAVATFAGAPYTDFALGNASRGAIAR